MCMLGYARVSTGDQDLGGQKRCLQAAGAYQVFEDVISCKTFEPPSLEKREVALLSLEKLDASWLPAN